MSNFYRALLLSVVGFALVGLAAGCGPGDDKSATVSITELDPGRTYTGVETQLSFEITPGDGTSADSLEWRVDFGDGATDSGSDLQTTVSHAYDVSGQYNITVVALADGTEVGSDSVSIEVLQPVDLEVSNVRGAPANVAPGDALSVSLTVSNVNAGPVITPFEVTVFASSSPSVTEEDLTELTPLGTGTIEPPEGTDEVIPAGRDASVGVDVDVPDDAPAGEQYVVAWINPEGQLADEDPSNNFATSTSFIRIESTIAGPDVTVENIVVIPDRAFPTLDQVTRTFDIRNLGGEEAFDVVARSYLSVGDDTFDENEDTLIDTTEPLNVPPQDAITVDPKKIVLDNEISPPAGEELEVYLIIEVELTNADGGDANAENDVVAADSPIVVSDEPVDGPDVVVNDFQINPQSTFLDGNLQVTLDLANEGNTDTGSFFCGVYIGQEPQVNTNADPRLWSINVSGIPAESDLDPIIRDETFPAIYDPGTYYFYVVCDPLGALNEQFRSNNQSVYLEPVTVTDEADVDLFADSLDVPTTANDGDTVELTARVCVTGSNSSGETVAELYRAPGEAPDLSDLDAIEPIKTIDIPNINPGDCEDIVIETTAACSDFEPSYGYGLVLDATETLPEQDESNNTKTGTNLMDVSGEFCSCTEDTFNNGSSSNALPITTGVTSDSICGTESCDFYSVELEESDSVVITTTYETAQGALETTLFDGSGITQLDQSSADGRQEVAEFLVPSAGSYVFSVCGAESDTQNLYDVNVDVLPQQSGVDVLPRSLEVPQGDSFSIGARLDLSFRVYNIGQTGTGGDFDANLYISPDNVIGDANDIPLNPASTTVTSLAGGSIRDVTVTARIPTSVQDGDYYLGVELPIQDDNTSNNTTVSRQLSVISQCYDPLEPNDSFSQAWDLSPGSYSNLVACTQAGDYYKLCVSDGKKFSAETNFVDDDGDIDMELYNEQGDLIDSSANTGVDTERVSEDYVNGGQCYFIYVYIPSGNQTIQTTYDMSVDVQDVDPSLRCDGYFEPNDDPSTAANLLAGLQQSGTIDRCPTADTDYYYVNLTAGQTITLRGILDPETQPGTLRVQLFKPNGDPGPNIETAPGLPVAELTDYVAPSDGRYLVQLTISGSARRATYRLEAEGLGGIDLEATNLVIGPGTYSPSEEVRYGFDLSNLRSDDATTPSYTVWLGDSQTHDPQNDTQLDAFTLSSDLAGNSSVSIADKVTLPSTLSDGTSYLHVVAEATNQTDPFPGNNIATTSIDLSSN
ncbi:MAG: CARDB domain-containing protein [Myxococcota bacterium]